MKLWQTSRREINCSEKTLLMGILNVTPDSFSDGGKFIRVDDALRQAEKMIAGGIDILDIGGESTRPQSAKISVAEEMRRVVPLVREIAKRFDVPLSVDTTKAEVAAELLAAGAEIINDVSGLRFDENMARVAAENSCGLILMHLRGEFETMHTQTPVENILGEVAEGFRFSLATARRANVKPEQIALDVGIGFSKTFAQNLELIAKLDKLEKEFSDYPLLVGTSRKSFIGKILDGAAVDERLFGSLASIAVAVWNGANIVRVHDVRETVETLKIIAAIKKEL